MPKALTAVLRRFNLGFIVKKLRCHELVRTRIHVRLTA